MRINPAAFLSFVAIVLFSAHNLNAASLTGKVIEVEDGDLLTVYNLNRPVKVRLLAVDAPEQKQPFGDIAREHLRTLVLNKFVTVEYWGLGQNNCLIGKVLVEGRDVGAQMIRDGVAWFDSSNKSPLSNTDCEIYEQSQQAAQSEKRGLWESEGAVPPWEFVKSERIKREALTRLVRSSNNARGNRPATELTNISLMGNGAGKSVARGFENRAAPYEASRKSWRKFQPAGEDFSVLVPVDGRQVNEPIATGSETVNLHTYLVRDGYAFYAVLWTTGPSRGERDVTVVKSSMREFLRGIEAGYSNAGIAYACGPESEQDISAQGFTGREIDLTGCTVPTRMRIFTRATDAKRQLYLAAVFYTQSEANVQKFLNSFSVGAGGNSQSREQKTEK